MRREARRLARRMLATVGPSLTTYVPDRVRWVMPEPPERIVQHRDKPIAIGPKHRRHC